MENSQTERYTFHEVLGEGSCGRVYRCTSPDGESRAVKVVTAMAINRDLVRYSLRKLDELPDHPGIAKVYSASLSDTPYHYVMDLFADPVLDEKGNEAWKSRRLDRVIGKIEREEAWRILDQIGEALAFLHGHDLFHACLKPSNIFLSGNKPDSEVKLSDPGQGWVSGAHYLELHDIPFYASPEQLRTAEFLDGHGKLWDVYSFGVLAFLLLNGRLPRLFDLFTERRRSGASWDSANDEDLIIEPFDQPPHEYADLLEAEPAVTWDFAPADESEERRIDILNRCLLLDSEERYPDMLEVVDSFRKERLATEVEGIEELAMGWKERVKKPFQNLGRHAAMLLAGLLLAVGAIVAQQMMLAHSRSKVAKTEENAKALLGQKDEEISAAEGRVVQERKEAEEAGKLESEARAQLGDAHNFGDGMFTLLKGHRGTDSVEYQRDRRAALQRGRDYYKSFIGKNKDNPGLVEETVVARGHLVTVLREIGTRTETLGALNEYAASIDKVLAESPEDDRLWKSRKARVHREAATIHLERSDLEAAANEAGKAVKIFENLAAEGGAETGGVSGGGVEGKLELAASLTLAGDVLLARKDMKGSKANFERSVELLIPLQEAAPEDARFGYQLAENLSRLGDIMYVEKDIEGSVSTYERSVALLGGLVRADPNNADYTHQLAHCFVVLGEIQSDRKAVQDALKILTQLINKDLGNQAYRHSLARGYGVMSELQRDGGQAANAAELQLAARDILEELVEASPDVQVYHFDYAACLSRLAGLKEDAGEFKESLAYLNEAVREVEALAKKSPESIQYQRSLAELRGNIGFANEKVGNKEKAKELYASAVYQWERLASLLPEDDLVERGLLWSRRQLAALNR